MSMRPRGQGSSQESRKSAAILMAIVLGVGVWLSAGRAGLAHCRDGTPACPDVIIQGTTLTIMDPTHTTIIILSNQSPGVTLPLPAIPPLAPSLAEVLAVPQPLITPPGGGPARPGQLVDLPPPGPPPPEPASPARPEAGGPVPPAHLPAFELDRSRPAPSAPQAATPSVGLVPLDHKGVPLESVVPRIP